MAAAGAADGMFRSIYEGCISGADAVIERRPYHKNCGCALHEKEGSKSRICSHHKTVSYPIRRSWSEGNFGMYVQASNVPPPSRSSSSNLSSMSSSTSLSNLASISPSSPPALPPSAADGCRPCRSLWTFGEEDYSDGFSVQGSNL